MSLLADVTAGNPTNATDINQVLDALNGNVAYDLQLNSAATFKAPIVSQLSGVSEIGVAGGLQVDAFATPGIPVGFGVNYKRTMVNVPTSITLGSVGGTSVSNANTITANFVGDKGFLLLWLVNAAGYTKWWGSYLTNGN